MFFNIAPYLDSNNLSILTAASDVLPNDGFYGQVDNVTTVGYDVRGLGVTAKTSNKYKWPWHKIDGKQIEFDTKNGEVLRHMLQDNPRAGANSYFADYNYPNSLLTLATSGRLTGCTALVLVLKNGVLFLHGGNDGDIDEDIRNCIFNAGKDSIQRAYRGWIYQLVWKHLESIDVPLEASNANVINSLEEKGKDFNQFIDSAVFCQRVLELDNEISQRRDIVPQILWGALVHNNRDPILKQPDVEQRAVGEAQRQIYIQTYDSEANSLGSLNFLINRTANKDVAVSTLACKWGLRSTQAGDGIMVRSATLTSRRMEL